MIETKKTFVIGYPIKHSRSPMVHGHWIKENGISGSYEKIAVEPENLKEFFASLKQNKYVGGNITIPHKESIFSLVDQVEEVATKIGAVNTVWFDGDILRGTNTDAYGFEKNLDHYLPDWSLNSKNETALVIGAGGAARAILYALVMRGFKSIILANRTIEKAEKLAEIFTTNILPIRIEDLSKRLPSVNFVVNTTSLGMNHEDPLPITISELNPSAIVTDIVYTPLETKLLKAAKDNGNQTVGGLGMLLHQAVPGFEKWFGVKPNVSQELTDLIVHDLTKEV